MNMYQINNIAKSICATFFATKFPSAKKNLENIDSGILFGFVQCDLEVPENFQEVFANYPTIFKNNNFGRNDIGPFMKEYAEKNMS